MQLTEMKLRKGVMHWWHSVQISRERVGKPNIRWRLSCKRVIFLPLTKKMSERIGSFTQDSMIVAEYSDESHMLSGSDEVDEPEYITMGR